MEALKNFARSLNQGNNKYYLVSVLVALIIVSVFVGSYYVLLKPPTKEFTTIYLLDSQEQELQMAQATLKVNEHVSPHEIDREFNRGRQKQIEEFLG